MGLKGCLGGPLPGAVGSPCPPGSPEVTPHPTPPTLAPRRRGDIAELEERAGGALVFSRITAEVRLDPGGDRATVEGPGEPQPPPQPPRAAAVPKPCSHTPSYLVTGCFLPLCTNKPPLEETGVLSGHRVRPPPPYSAGASGNGPPPAGTRQGGDAREGTCPGPPWGSSTLSVCRPLAEWSREVNSSGPEFSHLNPRIGKAPTSLGSCGMDEIVYVVLLAHSRCFMSRSHRRGH